MPQISICINLDTRNGFDGEVSQENGLFSGCKSIDFLIDGVINKRKFWDGFDYEVIAYVDVHNHVPHHVSDQLVTLCDKVVFSRHNDRPNANDWNYFNALRLAEGSFIVHYDQDCATFCRNQEAAQSLLEMLDRHAYVSYPSQWSPHPVHDPSYQGKFWVSTRFFACSREVIDFEELRLCFDYDYYVSKYDPPRVNPWTEHWLGSMCNNHVFYPPPQNDWVAFCWANYRVGRLKELNEMSYDDVCNYINSRGGIRYPCDVDGN